MPAGATILVALLAVATAPAVAASATADAGAAASGETAIASISHGGIADFRTDRDRGIWIRADGGRWFYARVAGRCPRLRGAASIGFKTRGGDDLDRRGELLVGGGACPLESIVASRRPPAAVRPRRRPPG